VEETRADVRFCHKSIDQEEQVSGDIMEQPTKVSISQMLMTADFVKFKLKHIPYDFDGGCVGGSGIPMRRVGVAARPD
jgi:hypothetical protein